MSKQKKAKDQTLSSAFAVMLRQPDIWKKLKVHKQTVLNRRVLVNNGSYPKDTTMRLWLKRTGWRMVQEERWMK